MPQINGEVFECSTAWTTAATIRLSDAIYLPARSELVQSPRAGGAPRSLVVNPCLAGPIEINASLNPRVPFARGAHALNAASFMQNKSRSQAIPGESRRRPRTQ